MRFPFSPKHVVPVKGALVVVIVGDALQIMSNDQYKSIKHRSITSDSRVQISVPIFVKGVGVI